MKNTILNCTWCPLIGIAVCIRGIWTRSSTVPNAAKKYYSAKGIHHGKFTRQMVLAIVFAKNVIWKKSKEKWRVSSRMADTHFCGNIYGGKKCENLLYASKKGMKVGKRELQLYYVYCTADGRCRSMGCAASWTGNLPKWCPKRRELEGTK